MTEQKKYITLNFTYYNAQLVTSSGVGSTLHTIRKPQMHSIHAAK